jgi:hypothetical protein
MRAGLSDEAAEATEGLPTRWRVVHARQKEGRLRLTVRRVAIGFAQAIARLEQAEAKRKHR